MDVRRFDDSEIHEHHAQMPRGARVACCPVTQHVPPAEPCSALALVRRSRCLGYRDITAKAAVPLILFLDEIISFNLFMSHLMELLK